MDGSGPRTGPYPVRVAERTAEYAFGRDEAAARRLEKVHAMLEPATRELLQEVSRLGRFELVFDLGCGPGLTSSLLDHVLHPARLVGLDVSDPFLRQAREALPAGRFVRHDLLQAPWPEAPADLAYARYVLTHLPGPEAITRRWLAQLRPGGLLVLEENEWIATEQPVFARYLELTAELLARRGHDLYVGRRLATAMPAPRVSRVREVAAPTAAVATMFRLNLKSWGPGLNDLDRELAGLERSDARGEITWGLRQLVIAPEQRVTA